MMRVISSLSAVFLAAILMLAAPATDPAEFSVDAAAPSPPANDTEKAPDGLQLLHQLVGTHQADKVPGASYRGDDSCRYANDGECDDPRIGTGACQAGTDYSDCWRIAQGVEDDSCRYANDGECDEPEFGTGACTQGTDRTDCGDIGYLRFQDDTCATAFDGVCNEPGVGNGTCAARTDRADCLGRDRPMQITDHFFGHDDRVLMDMSQFPWSVIGILEVSDGECTATLVAEDVIVTAAHCIKNESGAIDARADFRTGVGVPGATRSARVIGYLVGEPGGDKAMDESDYDWALLRLDQPLGRDLGFVGGRPLSDYSREQALLVSLYQAGYSWDTGDHLSGNIGCSVLELEGANRIRHNCDTTLGDSGSPLMIEDGGAYFIIATDSSFDSVAVGPVVNVATRADAWVPLLADFAAGRIGTEVSPAGGKAPTRKSLPVL